jgi:chromosome segregation ATPase
MVEQQNEQPLYPSGKYPSVVDTDDMVFEMGLQVVNRLNNEKLIKQALMQLETQKQFTAKQIEEYNKVISLKLDADNRLAAGNSRVLEFEQSNKLYEKTNRDLGDEIHKLRNQIQVTMVTLQSKTDELSSAIENLEKGSKLVSTLQNQIQATEIEYKQNEDNFKTQIEVLQDKIIELSSVIKDLEKRNGELEKGLKSSKKGQKQSAGGD